MFDALVRLKSPVLLPMVGNMGVKEGTYLGELPERVRVDLERNNRLQGNAAVKIIDPKIHGVRGQVGRGRPIVLGNEIRSYSQSTLDHSLVSIFAPNVDVIFKGQEVIVDDDNLLSYGTRGKLRGFSKGANGNILAYIDYNEDAAPLRISADKIKLHKPKQYWMVQPSHITPEGRNLQALNRNSNANTNERFIEHIFINRRSAQNYAVSLSRSDRDVNNRYVVLGVSDYVNREGQLLSYE